MKLEEKIKKMIEKNEKGPRFVNSFESFQEIKTQSRTFVQAQCDALIERKMREKEEEMEA